MKKQINIQHPFFILNEINFSVPKAFHILLFSILTFSFIVLSSVSLQAQPPKIIVKQQGKLIGTPFIEFIKGGDCLDPTTKTGSVIVENGNSDLVLTDVNVKLASINGTFHDINIGDLIPGGNTSFSFTYPNNVTPEEVLDIPITIEYTDLNNNRESISGVLKIDVCPI